MREKNSILSVVIYIAFSLFPFLLSQNSYAVQSVYTIQTGSFPNVAAAQEQFGTIQQSLDEKQLDYLRIEKIGKYYSVRLGKFKDRKTARKFFQPIKSRLPGAVVMDVYYKEERIVKLYNRPSSSSEEIKKISSLVAQKDYESALQAVEKGIAAYPDDPGMNGWYGTVLLKMKNPLKAKKYFLKAAELSPDIPDYHNAIGYCFFSLDKFHEAIDEFDKAASLDPAHIDALSGMGLAYVKLGKRDKATEVYNKLKDLDEDAAGKLLEIIRK